ncbi:type II secretion system F family protein [Marisediminicola senii]|uniref:type II secretion system F family protein n=1 Tax=Marisediminicola senii TaxID=2711233 RepID=UPI0013EE3D7D|nr:type II secretion system F family protein [Marisediminicola senii]
MVPVTSLVAWGAFCGVLLGFGLWSLVSLIPLFNRPRLQYRVAPYLIDISAGARDLLARRAVNPLPVVGTVLGPITHRLLTLLGGALGDTDATRVRLRQAGSTSSIEEFRSRQLLWGISGLGIGTLVAVAVSRAQSVSVIVQCGIVLVCGIGGVYLRDYLLKRVATARVARVTDELPTVLEFLTLSLSAGEGILDAIRRVSRVCVGELAVELAHTVAAVNTGVPFGDSLNRLANDLRVAPLSRAIDQIVGALERGTPLADVLRAQAQDARDEAKRALLETAGKKEVAMLVPLVFLILPLTVIFAIYPGVYVLQLGF